MPPEMEGWEPNINTVPLVYYPTSIALDIDVRCAENLSARNLI